MPWIATCKKQWADLTLALLLAFSLATPGAARPVKSRPDTISPVLPVREATFAKDVCALIENRSRWRGINPHFITRLIDVESRFSPNAVSPAGAEGIAQFIPGTAKRRGLKNPYDPAAALTASIDFLAHLKAQFGNLGLAAVAYNAGEGAAARFIKGGGIPFETENYVFAITGREAAAWRKPSTRYDIPAIHKAKPFGEACIQVVNRPGKVQFTGKTAAPRQPWGVLISEHFSRGAAVRLFRKAQRNFPSALRNKAPMVVSVRNLSMGYRRRYSARIGAASRAKATEICNQLRARAIACLVQKTR